MTWVKTIQHLNNCHAARLMHSAVYDITRWNEQGSLIKPSCIHTEASLFRQTESSAAASKNCWFGGPGLERCVWWAETWEWFVPGKKQWSTTITFEHHMSKIKDMTIILLASDFPPWHDHSRVDLACFFRGGPYTASPSCSHWAFRRFRASCCSDVSIVHLHSLFSRAFLSARPSSRPMLPGFSTLLSSGHPISATPNFSTILLL